MLPNAKMAPLRWEVALEPCAVRVAFEASRARGTGLALWTSGVLHCNVTDALLDTLRRLAEANAFNAAAAIAPASGGLSFLPMNAVQHNESSC